MSIHKLAILKVYLDVNVKKGFIYPFIQHWHLHFFVLKKQGEAAIQKGNGGNPHASCSWLQRSEQSKY